MYPLKFSPVKVCNNGEIRFFPTGVHQDDDPTPTVVEEPDWKLELVENDPEPEWEMPESGIYKASESFPFIDEGVPIMSESAKAAQNPCNRLLGCMVSPKNSPS